MCIYILALIYQHTRRWHPHTHFYFVSKMSGLDLLLKALSGTDDPHVCFLVLHVNKGVDTFCRLVSCPSGACCAQTIGSSLVRICAGGSGQMLGLWVTEAGDPVMDM